MPAKAKEAKALLSLFFLERPFGFTVGEEAYHPHHWKDKNPAGVLIMAFVQGAATPGVIVSGWAAWYADGSVYNGDVNTDWSKLPATGIQVVMVYYADGTRRIMQGFDYLFYAPTAQGPIYGGNNTDPASIIAVYPGAQVITGTWVNDAFYSMISNQAMASTWTGPASAVPA